MLVVAALGLPVNDLFRYAASGHRDRCSSSRASSRAGATRGSAPWRRSVLCVLAQVGFGGAAHRGGPQRLSSSTARAARSKPRCRPRRFASWPPSSTPNIRRSDAAIPRGMGCWRGQAFPGRPFAFSADGIYDRAALSRRVSGIDFADPVWLRLGFINEHGYNWNSAVSDVTRASRDRALARVDPSLAARDAVVRHVSLPRRFRRQRAVLARRGAVGRRGRDASSRSRTPPCNAARWRPRTPGGASSASRSAAAARDASGTERDASGCVSWSSRRSALIGAAVVLALLVRRARAPVCAAVRADGDHARRGRSSTMRAFIGGVRPFDSGDDGLVYDGYARIMLRQLMAGDIAGALEGGETVFYFTPGMRYLRAVEHLIFGESYLGYLSLMLLLPFLVFAMFRRFLPLRWALALTLVFAAIPIGVRVRLEPGAIRQVGGARLCRSRRLRALSRRLRAAGRPHRDSGPRNRFAGAAWAGLLFALALFVRPNIAPAAGILLAGAGLAALWQRQYRRVAGLCIGFLPVLGMALHNWVYGGVLVAVHRDRRASRLAGDAAVGLSRRARRARASRSRGRACDARAAADRRLARRAVRSARRWRRSMPPPSWCWCAWRCGDGADPWLRLTAVGDAGAAGCRAVLRQRRPLLLSDVAAHAPGRWRPGCTARASTFSAGDFRTSASVSRTIPPALRLRAVSTGSRARSMRMSCSAGNSLAPRARGLARRPSLAHLPRQGQKAVQLREQQRAEMELGVETAAGDQADDLGWRHQLHGDARFRLESLMRSPASTKKL